MYSSPVPIVPVSNSVPGLDYVAAQAFLFDSVKNPPVEHEHQRVILESCVRIVLAHGVAAEFDCRQDLRMLLLGTLDLIRPHYLKQIQGEAGVSRLLNFSLENQFYVRNGWEADVFVSLRPTYRELVLKIYRFHFLGGNPEHPGYGWAIDPQSIEKLLSGERWLPDTHFIPVSTTQQLRTRFFKIGILPFWARITNIWETAHALFLQQERVAPVKEMYPTELLSAAHRFLANYHGVYFTNAEGDLKNVGSVDTAVIVHRARFYLIQDYYFNLGFRLNSLGESDRSDPVMFDGHAFPLTPRYLEQFPSLAQAIMLIHRFYPDVPQDTRMIEIANQTADSRFQHDPTASNQAFNLYLAPERIVPHTLCLPHQASG